MSVFAFFVSDKHFSGYLPQAVLEEGLKTGRFVCGRLNVNRFNAVTEAFVARSGWVCDSSSQSEGAECV